MSEDQQKLYSAKPPIWFWGICVLFVLWNIVGVSNYLMTVMATPESLTKQNYSSDQVEFLLSMPPLYAAAFALAVWSGLLAAVLLLLRRRLAVPVYLASVGFVILSFFFDYIGGTFTVLGNAYLGIMGFVTVMAIVEYMFARLSRDHGWLR